MNSTLNLLLNIVEFIVALGILAGMHEFGHFLMARLSNIDVEEFGLGFPPRLVKLFTWRGTDFTLNWIPFGAFVRPKGENDPDVPGGLGAANPWKRLGVLLGGPVMNLLIGVLLFSLVFTEVGQPDTRTVQVIDTSPNSPAAQAGLIAGDVITQINGQIRFRSGFFLGSLSNAARRLAPPPPPPRSAQLPISPPKPPPIPM